MNAFLTLITQSVKWLVGILLLAGMGYALVAEPVAFGPSPWNEPVLEQGTWSLEGIVENGVQRRTLFEEDLDLVEVRYGKGSLWTLAGIQRNDGPYESLVVGSASREDVVDAFRQPRYITLSILGSEKAVSHAACFVAWQKESTRCRITRLVEGSRPPVVLDPYEEPTGDLSNVFIHTGLFVPHYQYGFLTWDILPGQVIEQGLEGG